MPTKALITLRETGWSGWDGGHFSTRSAQVWTEEKTMLSPETMGDRKEDYSQYMSLYYEVVVERIVHDVVLFAFHRLVVRNPEGGINLGGPSRDKFILRWGETKKLATPTMDAGTSLEVTVDEIR